MKFSLGIPSIVFGMASVVLLDSGSRRVEAAFLFGEPMIIDPHATKFMNVIFPTTTTTTKVVEEGEEDNEMMTTTQKEEHKLKLHLNIGPSLRKGRPTTTPNQATPRMPITNFGVSLQHKMTTTTPAPFAGTMKTMTSSSSSSTVKLPGAHGPHPAMSVGAWDLSVHRPGQFISKNGAQSVDVTQASWEVVWKKDAQAGSLIMGFNVAQDYERNGVHFPQGTVYIHFPVWSKEGLAIAKDIKARAFQRAQDALRERDEEIGKLQSTSNLLLKAWHYRNIYAAIETYSLVPLDHYKECIPDDHEIMELPGGDLFLMTRGYCWTRELPWGKEEILGTASLASEDN